MPPQTWLCPSCSNRFYQPFVCTTCGAEKLYDATLKSAVDRAESAEAKLKTVNELLQLWLDTDMDVYDEEYWPWLESFTARVEAHLQQQGGTE
jgi:hypothetical protein